MQIINKWGTPFTRNIIYEEISRFTSNNVNSDSDGNKPSIIAKIKDIDFKKSQK